MCESQPKWLKVEVMPTKEKVCINSRHVMAVTPPVTSGPGLIMGAKSVVLLPGMALALSNTQENVEEQIGILNV